MAKHTIITTQDAPLVVRGDDGNIVVTAPVTVADFHHHVHYDFGYGSVTGDIIRWDEEDGAWEVVSEPFEFNQITLTPAEVAVLNKEGSLFYCSTDKAVHVCTSDE